MQQRMKRLLTLFLILALGTVFLAACDAGGEETAEPLGQEDNGIVDDEGVTDDELGAEDDADVVGEDEGLTEDEELGEDELGADDTPFAEYDADDDDLIGEDEFNTFVTDSEAVPDDTAFADFDTDADGFLNEDEFNTVVSDFGVTAETGAAAGVEVGALVPTDQVLGTDILAVTGEDVGTIGDVLVDTQGGIQYIIVETEVGDEPTVAIDYGLLESQPATDTTETMTQTVTLLYSGDDITTETGVDITILDQEGAMVLPGDLGLEAEVDSLIQVSEFDLNLVTDAGEDVGEVEELLLDLQNGQVAYAISDIGGFLEVSENTIAIPWDRLEWDATQEQFMVNVDQATLEAAPVIDPAQLDEGLDEATETEINSFWESEAAPAS